MNDAFGTARKLLLALEAGQQTGRTTAAATAAKLCDGVLVLPTVRWAYSAHQTFGVPTRGLSEIDHYLDNRRPLVLDHTVVEVLLKGVFDEHRRIVADIQRGCKPA